MSEILFCKDCGKELLRFHKRKNKSYPNTQCKTGLCKNCCAKQRYNRIGMFTHNHGTLWNDYELEFLKENYADKSKAFLCNALNRSWKSIFRKAVRLKLYRNNPINNQEVRDKLKEYLLKNPKNRLVGCALITHLGLTNGKNHPNWLGGLSFEPYDSNFNETFKRLIRVRDNNECAICFKKGNEVHHIDYNKQNTCEENCITLCKKCHTKTQFNRDGWTLFFNDLIFKKYNNINIERRCKDNGNHI